MVPEPVQAGETALGADLVQSLLHVLAVQRAGQAGTSSATGERFIVGDERLGAQHPPGRLFTGRLVRVDGDDRWFFAMLPTVVEDEAAATELAEAAAAGAAPEARIDIEHRWMRQPRAA